MSPVTDILRSAASALLAQGALHSELIQLEWAEEKHRLVRMLVALLIGSLFLFCGLFSVSSMVLIFSWGTSYQNVAVIGLVLFYCSGILIASLRFNALAALANQAFAGSRAELAADIALIRSKLDAPR